MAKPGINSQFNIRPGIKRFAETVHAEKPNKHAANVRRRIEQLEDQKRLKDELDWLG